jgi:hypothetical protein
MAAPGQCPEAANIIHQNCDYFLSPVFVVSVVDLVVSEPPGVVTVVFFSTLDFSPQPTKPIENKLKTNADARIRFMFPFLKVKGYRTSLASPRDGQLSIAGPSQ